ncbi:cytochrome P450 9e2-like [Harpegnathos saltator]|uniref:cytochrome P450 9e2-like n=1 Tax=Harpegnathos saltator TaxID=610380 RepID=UPI000DBEDBA5|nr:cytochrome P450 9e2-like [Harpegnathos saltator]
MLYAIVLSALAGVLAIYYFFFKNPNKFKNQGIPYVRHLPLVGNMGQIIFGQESIPGFLKSVYSEHPEAKYIGMYDFLTPVIMLRDPELIKSIAITHFDMSTDHRAE